MFAGDTLIAADAFRTGDESSDVPGPMTVDRARSRDMIRKLADLTISRAYGDHGPPAEDASARLRALAEQLRQSPSQP